MTRAGSRAAVPRAAPAATGGPAPLLPRLRPVGLVLLAGGLFGAGAFGPPPLALAGFLPWPFLLAGAAGRRAALRGAGVGALAGGLVGLRLALVLAGLAEHPAPAYGLAVAAPTALATLLFATWAGHATRLAAGPLQRWPRALVLLGWPLLAPWRAAAWLWRERLGALAALGGGLALTFAIPPYDLWPLAFLALAPLLALLAARPARVGFALGWLLGAVLNAVAFAWLSGTMQSMSGFSAGLGAFAVALFGAYSGLVYAIAAAFVGPLRRRCGPVWIVVLPTLLALLEHVYPHLFGLKLGHTQHSNLPVLQIADLGGVPLLTWLVAFVNAALAEAALRLRARPREATVWRRAALPAGLAVALTAAAFGYGVWRFAAVAATPPTRALDVLLVQHNAHPAQKLSRDPAVRLGILDRAVRLTAPVVGQGVDLVVWPEGAYPFYFPALDRPVPPARGRAEETARRRLLALLERLDAPLVVGSLRQDDAGRSRNAALLLSGGPAAAPQIYDKHVLVAFGEYLPLRDWFPALRRAIRGVSDLAPGTSPGRFTVSGVQAVVTICYEAMLEDFTWQAMRDGGDVLVNLTNDGWFGPTRASAMHFMAQHARAVEHRVPLLRATDTGVSAIVAETGEVLAETGLYTEATLRRQLPLRPVFSFFRAYGNVFLWSAVGASVLLAGIAFQRTRRRSRATPPPGTGAGAPVS